jgi:4-amino-4-deoxy-L-arabinose transferase-like glycosyltransferase
VVAIYLALSVGTAMTKLPFNDEGWLASPGLNLITNGSMGTLALEPAGTWLTGIDTHTYWVMPLHSLTLAIWYDIFGFSAVSMRTLSVFWGLIALASWFLILKSLTRNSSYALLAVVLIALDYHFIALSAVGRMDMMSAALGFAGLAAYLRLRESDFGMALLFSHALYAASCLTHPYGGMALVAGVFLSFYFDRDRFKWPHLTAILVPYFIAFAGWGYYISRNPAAFLSQFTGNATAGGRFRPFTAPWSAIYAEVVDRYLGSFGFRPDASPLEHVRLLILLVYVAGAIAVLLARRMRKNEGYRVLLLLTGLYLLMMTFGEGKKAELYIIYAIPFWAAILAAWVHESWKNSAPWRIALATIMGGFLLLQTGNALYLIQRNNYGTQFLPVVRFIQGHMANETVVMGPSELGFELGFNGNLVDDFNLGYYSGKRPGLIVMDENYREVLAYKRREKPDLDAYVQKLLTQQYRQVYRDTAYVVYAQR